MILGGSVFAFKKILRSERATKEFIVECKKSGCKFSLDNGGGINLDELTHDELVSIAQAIWDAAIDREENHE